MKQIYRLIIHVTHNLFPLNEYSEGEIKKLINKFKEEADDLNINITDEQLKSYIERFDQLKNSPKISEKDLRKYSLSKLIKLVTSSKGAEPEDEIDITPDVVYNQDGLIIYNGSKEGNCLTFGSGERWCITRGSFGNYRYSEDMKHATFYLVRDTNKQFPEGDTNSQNYRQSFFVVVVGEDNTYKVSDRTNNDVGGTQTEWDRWENWNFVENHFPSIRGLKNIFKYIPLSFKEKALKKYEREAMSIKEWIKLPYNNKEQYLVIRKALVNGTTWDNKKTLFNDISNDTFVTKYLPKYPQIANFISVNYGILPSELLITHLDTFSNQNVKSIIANMRDKIPLNFLYKDEIDFEIKKILVKYDKIKKENHILYITKDNSVIVDINIISGNDINLNLITEDDIYNNVKINKRTAKYILEGPLDVIPTNIIFKFAIEGEIDKDTFKKYISNLDENPNLLIKNKGEEGKIIFDINDFKAYNIEGSDVTSLDINSPEISELLSNNIDNNNVKIKIEAYFRRKLSGEIVSNNIISILKKFITDTFTIDGHEYFVIFNNNNDELKFFLYRSDISNSLIAEYLMTESIVRPYTSMTSYLWRLLFDFYRRRGISYTSAATINLISARLGNYGTSSRKEWIISNPPLSNDNIWYPYHQSDQYFLINKQNPSDSRVISNLSGKLLQKSFPTSLARRVIGGEVGANTGQTTQPSATPQIDIPGRGRPPGTSNTQRIPHPEQPQRAGIPAGTVGQRMAEYNLTNGYQSLPRKILIRYIPSTENCIEVRGSRGAARRDNMLGPLGRVVRTLEVNRNSIYIIRLSNGNYISSINTQPGNGHYVVTSQGAFSLNSPSELVQVLRQRGIIAELRSFLTREYLERNSHQLDEIRSLLKKHIKEIKKQ